MFEDLFTTYSNVEIPQIKSNFSKPEKFIELYNSSELLPNFLLSTPKEELFSFLEEVPYIKPIKSVVKLQKLTLGLKVVDLARTFVGKDYVWGGKNPNQGFDCSGLISYVYKLNGIDIPSSTFGLFKTGKEVSLNDAQVGDIICTPGSGSSGKHVKMISKIENGLIYTIEAKGRKYGIIESPLDRTDNIITIRRILNKTNMKSNGAFSNKNDFIQTLNNTYRQVLQEHNLDPNYSYILTSSAALESGWGSKVSGDFNYGGVKGKTGTSKSTVDYVNGQYIRRNLTFKDFSSVKDYCNYVVNLLSNNRYDAFNKYSSSNPMGFWRHVLDSGYGGGDIAGKNRYMNSVNSIYNTVIQHAT